MRPSWLDNPVAFVRDRLKAEPDAWQLRALEMLGKPGRNRICMKACAGPGKTSVLAWSALWFMLTQLDKDELPNGICLSSTEDNLRTNLWKEIAKWLARDPLLSDQFAMNSERLYQKDSKSLWFLAARSYPQSSDPLSAGESLSGLHGDYVLVLLDEAGSMPPSILTRAEQALSNCKRGVILLAGNPTSRDSALYKAATSGHYENIKITADPDDPERTPRVAKEWAAEQIEAHGRNDPWVRSYILGEFPERDFSGLLSPEEVERSQMRSAPMADKVAYERRIGVDVARFGDDRTVLFPRQGRQAYMPIEMRNADGPKVVRRLQAAVDRWTPSPAPVPAIYVDDTGGYGSSVVDHAAIQRLGVIPVNVSESADDPEHYFNRRAEIYWRAAQWVKSGGCLPEIPGLAEEAAATQYDTPNGRLKLEPKELVKRRLGRSPDLWDAFCLTFSEKDRYINDVSGAIVTETVHSDSRNSVMRNYHGLRVHDGGVRQVGGTE